MRMFASFFAAIAFCASGSRCLAEAQIATAGFVRGGVLTAKLYTDAETAKKANLSHGHQISDVVGLEDIISTLSGAAEGELDLTNFFTKDEANENFARKEHAHSAYVPKTTTIAGLGLDSNITANALKNAMDLEIPDLSQFYDKREIDDALDLKAGRAHTHTASSITDFPVLAAVATTGSYNDLSNRPDFSGFATENYVNAVADGRAAAVHSHTKSDITDFPGLADVATSGDYRDLSNTPDLSDFATTRQLAAVESAATAMTGRYVRALELPATGTANDIYLLGPESAEKLDMYIYQDEGWLKVGDTSVNMSDYYPAAAIDSMLATRAPNAHGHAISDITNLQSSLDSKANAADMAAAIATASAGASSNYATAAQGAKADTALQSETDPTIPSWAKQTGKPAYTAAEVGARADTWTPAAADIPNLDASKITTGTIAAARIPTLNQNTTGNAATATTAEKLATARTIGVSLSGGVSGSGTATFDGSGNAAIAITTSLAGDASNQSMRISGTQYIGSGQAAGNWYKIVTFNYASVGNPSQSMLKLIFRFAWDDAEIEFNTPWNNYAGAAADASNGIWSARRSAASFNYHGTGLMPLKVRIFQKDGGNVEIWAQFGWNNVRYDLEVSAVMNGSLDPRVVSIPASPAGQSSHPLPADGYRGAFQLMDISTLGRGATMTGAFGKSTSWN